jgi:hypothetical protein
MAMSQPTALRPIGLNPQQTIEDDVKWQKVLFCGAAGNCLLEKGLR